MSKTNKPTVRLTDNALVILRKLVGEYPNLSQAQIVEIALDRLWDECQRTGMLPVLPAKRTAIRAVKANAKHPHAREAESNPKETGTPTLSPSESLTAGVDRR